MSSVAKIWGALQLHVNLHSLKLSTILQPGGVILFNIAAGVL